MHYSRLRVSLDHGKQMLNRFATTNILIVVINQVTMNTPTIKWKLEEVTIGNTFGALVLFYAFYDFFYMCFHRFLHMRFIYPV